MARGVQEGDGAALDVHGIGAYMLGDAAGLARGDVRLADIVEQAGLAVVNVAHDAGDEVLRLILAVVYEALLDGDDDLALDLAAELHRHKGGGVVVDDVRKRGHYAVLYERANDLGARLLHPGGQLAHTDGVGDLDLKLGLLGYLELQLLYALALFCAALGAGRGLLLALLLLVLELLLAALDVLARVRAGQAVKALVIFAEVHVAAAARVYDALLRHLARDVGLLLLRRRGLGLLGLRLGLLGRLRLLLALLLGRGLLRLSLLRCGLRLLRRGFRRLRDLEQVLHGGALVLLRQILENKGELLILQHLHVVLGGRGVLRQYLGDGL